MKQEHSYSVNIEWTGNNGSGTSAYTAYRRDHFISSSNKPYIPASSDPAFRGDPTRYNPEELLLASLSSCHMLWYLHLCAEEGVIVLEYSDQAKGTMVELKDGSGHFSEVTLFPHVKVKDTSMLLKAEALHDEAHKKCFIANSCNFPVHHLPTLSVA